MADRPTDIADSLPVAVIIPAYNRPALTARAVRSALAQRPRPPAEILVVDDSSTDDTGAAAADAGARVIRHERNQGESAARNTGVAAASQPWIATLDSDDAWLPDHLDRLWRSKDGAVLVSASALAVGDDPADDRVWGIAGTAPRELASPADLLPHNNFFVASGVLVQRDVVLAAGGFVPGMTRCADLDLWLRVLEHGRGRAIPDITVLYSVHPGQVSDDRAAMRDAHLAVVDAYRDRSWWSPKLRQRLAGAMQWDDLRAALRTRDGRAAVREGIRLARSPERLRGVASELRLRGQVRAATRRVRRGEIRVSRTV